MLSQLPVEYVTDPAVWRGDASPISGFSSTNQGRRLLEKIKTRKKVKALFLQISKHPRN